MADQVVNRSNEGFMNVLSKIDDGKVVMLTINNHNFCAYKSDGKYYLEIRRKGFTGIECNNFKDINGLLLHLLNTIPYVIKIHYQFI